MLADIYSRNKASVDKLALTEEEKRNLRSEAEMMKAQLFEDAAKLDSALAEIEELKRKVHETQYEVGSLTKKVETSSNHLKLTAEALEKTNLQLLGVKEANQFLETQMKSSRLRGWRLKFRR